MNIHEIKKEIDSKGSITIPAMFASTVMQECENHNVNADWNFSMKGKECRISRQPRQGEDHPMHTNRFTGI
jgi:DNA-binding transcriptional regulator/RsmH inhibitor MraZ